MVVRASGELLQILEGPLGELGVKPRGSPEKNPRANSSERVNGIYARLAQRDFGASWRPPRELREATGIDERVARHLKAHCKSGEPTELLSLGQVRSIVRTWVREINYDPDNKVKRCHGMTRHAAFRQLVPPPEERAKRRVPQQLIDWAFAEHFERAVRAGGVIELPDFRYSNAVDLLNATGEIVKLRRFRRDKSQVYIELGDRVVTAQRRVPVGTKDPEALAHECERLARDRKAIAGVAPEEPPRPASAPGEISSSEWIVERIRRARRTAELKAEEIEPTAKPEGPGLHDLKPLWSDEL